MTPRTPPTPEQHFARYRDAGDLASLAAVFDAVAGELLLVAGHLVRDGALAEDLVQTTFVEAMRVAGRYDARRPLLPWLASILTHHARKAQQRMRRDERGAPRALRDEPSAADRVLDREAMAAIESGLARLDPPYRHVLTLRLVHEMTPAAIAHSMGCSPETVKTRLKRGLERLRLRLPAGLATSLALLLASGRGLAAVRADVLAHARELVTRASVGAGTAGVFLGGFLVKQFLLRATIVVAVVLSGWWGFDVATSNPPAPGGSREPAVHAFANADPNDAAGAPTGREVVAAPAPRRDEVVFLGRCVAAGDGRPLAGVPIRVPRPSLPPDLPESDYTEADFQARAESATDGSFVCRCERRDGVQYAVRVGGSEHVLRTRSFGPYATPREVDLGDVPLRGGIRLISRVVDRSGKPVAGLVMSTMAHGTVGRADTLWESASSSGRTDADGRLAWPRCLLPGRHRVMWEGFWNLPADRQGTSMLVAAAPAVQENVIVWPIEDGAQSIHGIVVDTAGVPVPQLDLGALGGGTRGNARTLDDGTFQIPRVGPFDPQNRGPVGFGLPDAAQGFELAAEATCSWGDRDVRLVVRPGATLVVRAVDAATGETVRDVDVACAAHLDGGTMPAISWARPSTCGQRPDGTVLRKLARCPHDVQVFAKERFAPSPKVVWDPRDGEQLVVPLSRLRTATVRVIAADGTPIAGTELWALQPIEATAGATPAAGWRSVAPPAETRNFGIDATTRWARDGVDDAPLGSARTGADGRATLPVPANADVLIAALGPGHLPTAIVGRAEGGADIELRVDRGATIHLEFSPPELAARLGPTKLQERLQALGANDVVARGATVWVQRVIGDDQNHWENAATIDLDGSARCTRSGLAAGEYRFYLTNTMQSASAEGILVGRTLARVTLRDGEERTVAVDLSALATGRLRGRVLVNGSPWLLGSGLVYSHPGTAGLNDDATVEFATDARGEFDVEVPAGEYRLHMYYRSQPGNVGYWHAAERARVVAGAATDAVFTARFVTARVRVSTADGKPAVGLVVTMDCTAEPKGWQWWTTDADGWITIELTHTSPFTLVVANPDGPARAGRRTTSSGDAVLGPFRSPPTGDTSEFRAVLPEGWR